MPPPRAAAQLQLPPSSASASASAPPSPCSQTLPASSPPSLAESLPPPPPPLPTPLPIKSLEDLTAATTAARDHLRDEILTTRDAVKRELQVLLKRQRDAADRVDKAAVDLGLRALRLDNRALELERRDLCLRERELHLVDRERALRTAVAAVRERETVVAAREAGFRYSVVEQDALCNWERRLEKREEDLCQAEAIERKRVAEREAAVEKREASLGERQRSVSDALKEREAAVAEREAQAHCLIEGAERKRAEALMRIEVERELFWAHQRKLSAVVAAQVDALLEDQRSLRAQFEGEAAEARRALREMAAGVALIRGRVERAANGVAKEVRAVTRLGERLDALSVGEVKKRSSGDQCPG